MTPENFQPIPPALVERFVQAFDEFLACLQEAIAHAAANPATSNAEAVIAWRTRALPVLERFQKEIHAAAEAFAHGDAAPIVDQADRQAGLAKNLDGYPLDFAGSEYEKKLDELETVVVVTGDRVYRAAGRS